MKRVATISAFAVLMAVATPSTAQDVCLVEFGGSPICDIVGDPPKAPTNPDGTKPKPPEPPKDDT